jgi:hypothetical protein
MFLIDLPSSCRLKTKHVSCSKHSFSFLVTETDLGEEEESTIYLCSRGMLKMVEIKNKKKALTFTKTLLDLFSGSSKA